MDLLSKELKSLIAKGKSQGYLTYDDVNAYLPDEEVVPDKLDNLLIALEERGIDIVNAAAGPRVLRCGEAVRQGGQEPTQAERICLDDEHGSDLGPAEVVKFSSDPIRMYLSQMAEIPLLSREEEISLAKKIEVTRKRFRRTVIGCNMAMRSTRRHADEGLQRQAAVRSHDQGLADRASDQGADHRPDAAQPADAAAPDRGESPRFRAVAEPPGLGGVERPKPASGSSAAAARC